MPDRHFTPVPSTQSNASAASELAARKKQRPPADRTALTIRHTLSILRAMHGKGWIGIRDIATATNIAPSSVHRLMVTLYQEQEVEQEQETLKYRLSRKGRE